MQRDTTWALNPKVNDVTRSSKSEVSVARPKGLMSFNFFLQFDYWLQGVFSCLCVGVHT